MTLTAPAANILIGGTATPVRTFAGSGSGVLGYNIYQAFPLADIVQSIVFAATGEEGSTTIFALDLTTLVGTVGTGTGTITPADSRLNFESVACIPAGGSVVGIYALVISVSGASDNYIAPAVLAEQSGTAAAGSASLEDGNAAITLATNEYGIVGLTGLALAVATGYSVTVHLLGTSTAEP